ncbi:hypothetical protein LXL04_029012 [Taraxacum kok-saghyz]
MAATIFWCMKDIAEIGASVPTLHFELWVKSSLHVSDAPGFCTSVYTGTRPANRIRRYQQVESIHVIHVIFIGFVDLELEYNHCHRSIYVFTTRCIVNLVVGPTIQITMKVNKSFNRSCIPRW